MWPCWASMYTMAVGPNSPVSKPLHVSHSPSYNKPPTTPTASAEKTSSWLGKMALFAFMAVLHRHQHAKVPKKSSTHCSATVPWFNPFSIHSFSIVKYLLVKDAPPKSPFKTLAMPHSLSRAFRPALATSPRQACPSPLPLAPRKN